MNRSVSISCGPKREWLYLSKEQNLNNERGLKMNRIINSSRLWLCLLVGAMLLATSCASIQRGYHAYVMRGSIVDVSESHVYLCIGSKDGAAVGQELNVYKIVQTSTSKNRVFRKEFTGKVKIAEIVDEHFAKAEVISGKAEKNDVVELISPKER